MSADRGKATAREPGWYWVSYKGRDVVSEWDGTYWRLQAARAISDEVLEKIGPRILDPDATSERAKLLATLRDVTEFCESLETGYQARVAKINNDVNKACLTVASECARYARAALAKAEERG